MFENLTILEKALIFTPGILLGVVLHELAHGYVAYKCGDSTAKNMGRLTLNPIKHMDLFGTFLLPMALIFFKAPFLFGYAKPVPVAFQNLRNPRRDMVLVAAAGPATNFIIAILSGIGIGFWGHGSQVPPPYLMDILAFSLLINVTLGIFNLCPLLPLDGGRILTGLLPPPLAREFAKTERFGFLILLTLIIVLPMVGQLFSHEINFFREVMGPMIQRTVEFILNVTHSIH